LTIEYERDFLNEASWSPCCGPRSLKEEYDFSGNGAKFVLLEMETRYNAGEV
jgi:hypothetical protein